MWEDATPKPVREDPAPPGNRPDRRPAEPDTAGDNLVLWAQILLVGLALAGLEGERAAYPSSLSGGMKRRLALVRALALGGKLYLLDEPFTGVDGGRIQDLMAALKALGAPVLLSSHEALVRSMADQVVLLDGPPLRVLSPSLES